MLIVRTLERSCGKNSAANNYCRCDVSAFDLRRSMCRLSKIDVLTFDNRCRPSEIDVLTFDNRCRPSEINVLTFDDRCVDLRISVIDVSTFED